MGIEDRDYYRQEYARKNGMHYDTKTATYSTRIWAKPSTALAPEKKPFEWHWSLVLLMCLVMAVAAAAFVHYFPRIAAF